MPFDHFVMTDFGVEKGKTAITGDVIETVVAGVAARIAAKAS